MKRYKVTYWSEDRSEPLYLTEISKSGRIDGIEIRFYSFGKKAWQEKYKNDLRNGIIKSFWYGVLRNFKKDKLQGINVQLVDYFK